MWALNFVVRTRDISQFVDQVSMKSLHKVRLDASLLGVQEISFLYGALSFLPNISGHSFLAKELLLVHMEHKEKAPVPQGNLMCS